MERRTVRVDGVETEVQVWYRYTSTTGLTEVLVVTEHPLAIDVAVPKWGTIDDHMKTRALKNGGRHCTPVYKTPEECLRAHYSALKAEVATAETALEVSKARLGRFRKLRGEFK